MEILAEDGGFCVASPALVISDSLNQHKEAYIEDLGSALAAIKFLAEDNA